MTGVRRCSDDTVKAGLSRAPTHAWWSGGGGGFRVNEKFSCAVTLATVLIRDGML